MALKENGDKIKVAAIITRDQKNAIDAYSKITGLNMCAVIRLAVTKFFESQKN